jgi:hypothetical protein
MGYSKPLPCDLEDFTWLISRLWYVPPYTLFSYHPVNNAYLLEANPLTSPLENRPPSPLRNNDVYLRLPRRNHHAPLQRVRRALSRNLRRRLRLRFCLPTPKTRQFLIQHSPSNLYLRRSSIFYPANSKTATKSVRQTADSRTVEP